MAASLGKRVVDDLYVHVDAIDRAFDGEQLDRVKTALRSLAHGPEMSPNVVKLNLRNGRLSLLHYRDFEEAAFPELASSWAFGTDSSGASILRTYGNSLNPPILHRKELLVDLDHPKRTAWEALTKVAESLGLFDETAVIGFKMNWERAMRVRGYDFDGEQFVPIGNAVPAVDFADASLSDVRVQRHLTALTRSSLSAPVQLLIRHGLLAPSASFFDYGCGRGGDVAALREQGYEALGWDPHFAPESPTVASDVVNLGFVINVIEDPAERVDALHGAYDLTRRVLAVGVMLHGASSSGLPYNDGVLTSRNTFQKYFSQAELKDYLEQVLDQPAFMVGPGVALVFADKDLEQRFCSGRFRSRGVAERLLRARVLVPRIPRTPRERVVRAPRQTRAQLRLQEARPYLESLWARAIDLGRWPEDDELGDLVPPEGFELSSSAARRLIQTNFDMSLLERAAKTRSDDLLVFLGAQQFAKRPAYKQLEPRLQRDIKSFFGDYRSAQAAALRLLLESGDATKILAACQLAAEHGLGWLEGTHSLQLHLDMVERLPAILRAYVSCGLVLWDSTSDVQLVKIHIESGKLTLLEFEDFDDSALPLLRRRIKINLRRLSYDVFEYGSSQYPKPLLFRKSRYLHEDSPRYAEQVAFDDQLESLGILVDGDPLLNAEELAGLLERRRLAVAGLALVRSQKIPDLDARCGDNFTYRSLIECGETQRRTGMRNVPLKPDTYSALYDLATKVLDPLIDYFGPIKLTYGFCSPDLSRAIQGRVAPKLDQHAGCEVDARGRVICPRLGAACDFIVDDEDMLEVASWIVANLPFDRLYYYGVDRPLHVSFGPDHSRLAFEMVQTAKGNRVPRPARFDPKSPR